MSSKKPYRIAIRKLIETVSLFSHNVYYVKLELPDINFINP